MTWTLNVGGHANSQEEEASLIDRIEDFVASLGEDVWHSVTTSFHGAGTVETLRNNVTPRDEADTTPDGALVSPGADGTEPSAATTTPPIADVPADTTPVTDTGTTDAGTTTAGSDFAPADVPPAP